MISLASTLSQSGTNAVKYSDIDLQDLVEKMPPFWYSADEEKLITPALTELQHLPTALLNEIEGNAMKEVICILERVKEKRIFANECCYVLNEKYALLEEHARSSMLSLLHSDTEIPLVTTAPSQQPTRSSPRTSRERLRQMITQETSCVPVSHPAEERRLGEKEDVVSHSTSSSSSSHQPEVITISCTPERYI